MCLGNDSNLGILLESERESLERVMICSGRKVPKYQARVRTQIGTRSPLRCLGSIVLRCFLLLFGRINLARWRGQERAMEAGAGKIILEVSHHKAQRQSKHISKNYQILEENQHCKRVKIEKFQEIIELVDMLNRMLKQVKLISTE